MSVRDVGVRVNVDASTNGATGKLRAFSGVARGAAAAGAAIAAGAALGAAKLYEIGDRADDSNARIRNITARMGLFGMESERVAARLVDLANKQALANGVDQNTIKATQAKLLTFRQVAATADQLGGVFDRTTQAAVDLAAAGFGTAEGNAVQLGKALNDPINGLSALARAGVTFTEAEKKRIETLVESNRLGEAQVMVLQAIETQVGGTAASMSGGLDRMKIKFSQLAEEIGMKLVPIVDKAADFIVRKALPAVQQWAAEMREKLGPTLARIGAYITERVIPAAQQFYRWFVEKIVPGIRETLAPVLQAAREQFNKISNTVSDNSSELQTLREWFAKVAEFIATKVGPIYGKYLKTQLEVAGTAISKLISFISFLVGKLQSAYDLALKVGSAFSSLKDKASSIPGAGLIGSGLSSLGGAVGNLLPRTAPSSIAPPAPRLAPSGGGTVQVYATGLSSPGDIARQVESALLANTRRLNRPGASLYRPDLGWA